MECPALKGNTCAGLPVCGMGGEVGARSVTIELRSGEDGTRLVVEKLFVSIGSKTHFSLESGIP